MFASSEPVLHSDLVPPPRHSTSAERWLLPVIPQSSRVTDSDDRYLGAAALAAIAGDRIARDALYGAFAPRLEAIARRVARRLSSRSGYFVDFDDARQESFLVFVALLDRWPGESSFAAYITGLFAHRLRDALPRNLPPRSLIAAPASWLADESYEAEEARVLLEALAENFPLEERVILMAHIRDGESLTALARRLGVSRRTVQRRWSRIVAKLRGSFSLPEQVSPSGRCYHLESVGTGRDPLGALLRRWSREVPHEQHRCKSTTADIHPNVIATLGNTPVVRSMWSLVASARPLSRSSR